MTDFEINKDQISRLKMLSDYIKKVEGFSPISGKQIFIVNKDKLNIYGTSTTSHVESSFDIKTGKIGKNVFEMQLTQFINYLEKIKSDVIKVQLNNDKLKINGDAKDATINQAIITSDINDVAIKELTDYVSDVLGQPEFENPIEVDLTLKDVMVELGNLTKFQDTNHEILLNKNSIKTADILCIINYKSTKQISSENEILIDRDIMPLFRHVDTFKISSDKKYYYFDIDKYGIKIIFAPKSFNWSYPTDDELKDIVPDANKILELEIDSEKFYEAIGKFDNIFESGTWRYGQIKVNTPTDFANKKELKLHYDNMSTEMFNTLSVDIKTATDTTEDFEFMIPTLHFKFLENILMNEPTFKLQYSSADVNDTNGLAIKISNKIADIILAKIVNT